MRRRPKYSQPKWTTFHCLSHDYRTTDVPSWHAHIFRAGPHDSELADDWGRVINIHLGGTFAEENMT